MYDPATDSWTRKADMPTGRLWVSSSVVDGKIYTIGGSSGPDYLSPSLATVEMYDPATDTWTQKADMPTARSNMATVVVDGNIFALGGWVIDQDGTESKAVEVYNPATDTWTPHTEMLDAMEPRAGLLDGKIYATDGSYLEVYDPTTESWSKFNGIPYGTMFASICPLGNLLLTFGGAHVGGSGALLADIYVYDPSTDTWEKLPDDMPFKGWLMSASEGDGKIYIIGGSNQDWEVYAYADPESSDNPPPMSGVWEVTIES
jgi:N-acetylneuraminic acid mutarotase